MRLEVLAVLFSFGVASVLGAGYIGVKRPSQGRCTYEDINDAHFSYDRNSCEGPSYWFRIHECWRTCGSKKRQSPINIDTSSTRYRNEETLEFDNLCSRVDSRIYNNGHSPHFEAEDREIYLSHVPGRNPDTRYVFAEMHAHLGRKRSKGSEHSINQKFSPMEAHMVFYDSKYESAGEAKSQKDALVVLGVMVQVAGGDDDDHGDKNDCNGEKDGDNGEQRNGDNGKQGNGDNGEQRNGDNGKQGNGDNGEHGNGDNGEHGNGDNGEQGNGDNGEQGNGDNGEQGNGDNGDNGEQGNGDNGSHRHRNKKCHHKCKVRYAKKLSKLMEKYYKEIRIYKYDHSDFKGRKEHLRYQYGQEAIAEVGTDKCKKEGPDESEFVDVEEGITPSDALPFDQRFYTYDGSLTTPPCFETVRWVVFKCPIKVSRKAFRMLQKVQDSHRKPLKHFGIRRPIQKNSKPPKVTRNFKWGQHGVPNTICHFY